jgi:replicative DNA helicase
VNTGTIQPSRRISNGHRLQSVEPTALYANPAAERALLGALATSGRRDDLVRVEREDFTIESHRVLFDAIARRLDAGEPIDFPLLADDVRPAGVSSADVFELFDNPGVSVPAYVPLLHACRMRRLLHGLGACLETRAGDAACEPHSLLHWLERQVGLIETVAARR